MRGYRRFLRLRLGARRDVEREMVEEIDAHLAMRMDDLVRGGMSPERARAAALERFGDRAVLMRTVVERERRLSRGERMQNFVRDLPGGHPKSPTCGHPKIPHLREAVAP